MWDLIFAALTPNADPIDALVDNGAGVYAFIYCGSHNANSWKSATNATHTVNTGKKLVVLQTFTTPAESDTARDARLQNTTDATTVIRRNAGPYPSSVFPWEGDLATASKFPEVAAGKTVTLQIWNQDTNKRAMCWIVIAREEAA